MTRRTPDPFVTVLPVRQRTYSMDITFYFTSHLMWELLDHEDVLQSHIYLEN